MTSLVAKKVNDESELGIFFKLLKKSFTRTKFFLFFFSTVDAEFLLSQL